MNGTDRLYVMDAIQDAARYLPLLEPDPVLMKIQLENWARGKMYKWETLYRSMNYKYDLMTNVDFTETYTERIDEAGNQTGQTIDASMSKVKTSDESAHTDSKDTSETTSGTEHNAGLKDTDTTGKRDVSTSGSLDSDITTDRTYDNTNDTLASDSRQGFNSNVYRPVTQTDAEGHSHGTEKETKKQNDTTSSGEHETTSGGVIEDSTSDTETSGKRNVGETGKANDTSSGTVDTSTGGSVDTKAEHAVQKLKTYEHRTVGDKGNTSRPEQIQLERDIADLDLYAVIAGDFVYRFCVMVY